MWLAQDGRGRLCSGKRGGWCRRCCRRKSRRCLFVKRGGGGWCESEDGGEGGGLEECRGGAHACAAHLPGCTCARPARRSPLRSLTFAARAAQRERLVLLVLDLEQDVEHHGPALVEVNLVGRVVRLLAVVRVPAVVFVCLGGGRGGRGGGALLWRPPGARMRIASRRRGGGRLWSAAAAPLLRAPTGRLGCQVTHRYIRNSFMSGGLEATVAARAG